MSYKNVQDYPQISILADELNGYVDWEELFARPGPVHIEIGSGRGAFLLAQGRYWPQTNFLGIEWGMRYYRHAVDRAGRRGLENVRLIRTDAVFFVRDNIGDESVDGFHIYFPDPWPKKRHNRRRFFDEKNLLQMIRTLKPGGLINAATDHADYFRQMRSLVDGGVEMRALEEVEFFRPAGAETGEVAGTNYERKYLKEGRCIYSIAARKL